MTSKVNLKGTHARGFANFADIPLRWRLSSDSAAVLPCVISLKDKKDGMKGEPK
jgi:hypothetical protein